MRYQALIYSRPNSLSAFSVGSKSVDDTISLRFISFVRREGGFEMLSDQRVVRLFYFFFFFSVIKFLSRGNA